VAATQPWCTGLLAASCVNSATRYADVYLCVHSVVHQPTFGALDDVLAGQALGCGGVAARAKVYLGRQHDFIARHLPNENNSRHELAFSGLWTASLGSTRLHAQLMIAG
jgi:hypothetical protein